jgi:uncharacterized damage-inducible protein DinB
MNANAFRHLYEYHFNENRMTWEKYIVPLSHDLFVQPLEYSMGSVRNQVVHLMGVDDGWFSALRGIEPPEWLKPEDFPDKATIRAYWDGVEQRMRGYLATLRDEMLLEKPFAEGEDKDLILWQVLLHVANHGTDHRAQILRALHDFGVKTVSQDYVFYAYDYPLK